MSKKEKTEERAVETRPRAQAADAAGGNVDKIRDILFGAQLKDYESRFARLEDTLQRETADLKDSLKRRFDTLEAYFKKESESLAARLKTERDERTDSSNALSREHTKTSEQLSKKLGDLANTAAEDKRVLRQELMTESKNLVNEIRQKFTDLSTLLEKRVVELRTEKTDRAALASLLTEMAIRLTDDLPPSKGEK